MTDGLIRVAMHHPGPVFGLVVRDGHVAEAAPVARYALGWPTDRVLRYFRGRGAEVAWHPDCEEAT